MNICVFCASSNPKNEMIVRQARRFAELLADNKHTLVYGGAGVGLMGLIADTILEKNGRIIGIMPEALTKREIAYKQLTERYIVGSMAERKEMMIAKSEAFVILPGGLGTLDELFEAACLASLGLCRKPIAVLNSCGYYDSLRSFLDNAVQEGLIEPSAAELLNFVSFPEEIFTALAAYKPLPAPAWVKLQN
ncbi:TIGR00730 family Rossman fold protein [bacterium]|nr:TIGR00730 family Rossman fold protein [bacterium]